MTRTVSTPFVYLASQSPRRRQLLDQIGVRHELLLPGPQEDAEALEAVLPGEPALAYVQRVTALKLQAACERWRQRALAPAPILCADTTVAIGRRILGKPEDDEQARAMLRRLSGRRHQVLTAVALARPGSTDWVTLQAVSRSRVTFEPLTESDIERYVASGEPRGKAGAYAIQSQAACWISHIEGSYSGIMGLPLHETARLLRQAGLHP